MDGDLSKDNSSSVGASLSETMGSFPLLRTTGCSARSLFSKFEAFFFLGPQLIILTLRAFSASL